MALVAGLQQRRLSFLRTSQRTIEGVRGLLCCLQLPALTSFAQFTSASVLSSRLRSMTRSLACAAAHSSSLLLARPSGTAALPVWKLEGLCGGVVAEEAAALGVVAGEGWAGGPVVTEGGRWEALEGLWDPLGRAGCGAAVAVTVVAVVVLLRTLCLTPLPEDWEATDIDDAVEVTVAVAAGVPLGSPTNDGGDLPPAT